MTDAYIVTSGTSYRYNFDDIIDFSDKQQQAVMEFPLPESTADENLIYRFDGQTNEVRLTFAIINNGTDRSASTYGSTIITVAQQTDYLKNHIFTEGASTYWTLTEPNLFSGGVTGAITDISIKQFPGRPGYAEGTLTFTRGEISS